MGHPSGPPVTQLGGPEFDRHGSAPCSHLGMEHAEAGAGAMLVACRLAGPSALEGHYAGVRARVQFGRTWVGRRQTALGRPLGARAGRPSLPRWEALITRATSRRSSRVTSGQRVRIRSTIIAARAASSVTPIGGRLGAPRTMTVVRPMATLTAPDHRRLARTSIALGRGTEVYMGGYGSA